MSKRVLITGGAGFIGSHLGDHLLESGHIVRALDSLSPDVHGSGQERPQHLDPRIDLIVGDVRNPNALRDALRDVDAVVHLAATSGVSGSRCERLDCTSTNIEGTARLLEALIERPVERLVVASSMGVYGEGLYEDASGNRIPGVARSLAQLRSRTWDLWTEDGALLLPVPTPEAKPPELRSVYALSKYAQEQMCLITGRARGASTVALRLASVYGPRQVLAHPHAGVVSVFTSRLMRDRAPRLFEDGFQQRDFVSVHDVARACRLALESDETADRVLNIGGGSHCTIREIAARLAYIFEKEHLESNITENHRPGDIRHCFADISRAREVLGYEPQVTLEAGLAEFGEWVRRGVGHSLDRDRGAGAEPRSQVV